MAVMEGGNSTAGLTIAAAEADSEKPCPTWKKAQNSESQSEQQEKQSIVEAAEMVPRQKEEIRSSLELRHRSSKSMAADTSCLGNFSNHALSSGKEHISWKNSKRISPNKMDKSEFFQIDQEPMDTDSRTSSEVLKRSYRNPDIHSNFNNVGESISVPAFERKTGPVDSKPVAICAGDTFVFNDFLDSEPVKSIFEKVRDEVRWQKMSHQGGDVPRLVCVQGEVAEDGSIPIYRHPADESPSLLPFSRTVSLIRQQVQEKLGHPVNHVLIQFYRNGNDHISEHSDKTLDIVPATFIANVSLGAQRTMVFRTKKPEKDQIEFASGEFAPRQVYRATLAHNSLCKMGLVTNMRWLHGIRQDKRHASEKYPQELAYNGGRISLTFRMIGTFLDNRRQRIWGQGATAKNKAEARKVVNGNTKEAEKIIRAFGKENRSSTFDWNQNYGAGFDVLHISSKPELFLHGEVLTGQ